MIRSFLRSSRSIFLYPSRLTINISILIIIVVLIFYSSFDVSLKVIPALDYLGWITKGIILAFLAISLFYLSTLVLIQVKPAISSRNKTLEQRRVGLVKSIFFSLLLGGLGYCIFCCFMITYWTHEISQEELIGQLNYPSYGKTIYVYAEKRCLFDCNLYYSFWLQYPGVPLMHSIATFEDEYDYNAFNTKEEKAVYQTYLSSIQEEAGIVKIPFKTSSERESFFYYNLKTGESLEEPTSRKKLNR